MSARVPSRDSADAKRLAPFDDNAAMGKVIFLMNVSLDSYIETADHSLDWTITDVELHTWFND